MIKPPPYKFADFNVPIVSPPLVNALVQPLTGGLGAAFTNTKSLLLDGVDEYVEFGTDASLQFVGSDFSAMGWYKYVDEDKFEYLMGNDVNDLGWGFVKNNASRMALYIGSELKQAVALVGTANIWTHLAVTFELSTKEVIFYVDGGLIESNTFTTVLAAPAHEFTMGIDPTDQLGITYQGNMNQCACYNSVIDAAGIFDIYNSGPKDETQRAGAVSQWPMGSDPLDDATGTTGNFEDVVGANNGTPFNTEAGDIVEDVP